MNTIQKKSKNYQTIIIKTHTFGQSNDQYYRQYRQATNQQPQLVMYQLLRSILRKQIRQPFQLIKSIGVCNEEDEIWLQRRHTKYELEVIGENITNVATSVQQRIIIQAFITIKNAYAQQLRKEDAYYNQQNLDYVYNILNNFQKSCKSQLKRQGFSCLKFYKQSKVNQNKYNNFNLNSQKLISFGSKRPREIEAINSYIINNEQEEFSVIKRTQKQEKHRQIKQNKSIENHLEFAQGHKKKRVSDYPSYAHNNEELQEKIFITHRKNTENQQPQSTNLKQSQNHVFLIQDYRVKPRKPTNFIKIPVASQNVKIVQMESGRKSIKKQRIVRQEQQIQRQICSDCKYCKQMKQRKQILKFVEQRLLKHNP